MGTFTPPHSEGARQLAREWRAVLDRTLRGDDRLR